MPKLATLLTKDRFTDKSAAMTVFTTQSVVYDDHSDVDFEEQVPFAVLVQEGAIMKAKPKHFLPRPPGTVRSP